MSGASPAMTLNSADNRRRDPACAACSKSKRRCSKQHPVCRRCRHQNLHCIYPLTRMPAPQSPQSSNAAQSSLGFSTHGDSNPRSLLGISPPESHVSQVVDPATTSWFLEPSAWAIDHEQIGEDDRITYPDSGLDYFIGRVRIWLDQWTSENHCAFVHRRLYGIDLPKSLQHAFAAWRVYRSASNPTSLRIALRMAADWSNDLVQEVAISETLLEAGETPNLRDQLGRTQAMFIFQVIGLFDGDVRARASSETLLSTVTKWADALLQAAMAAAASDQTYDSEEPLNSPQINQLRSDGTLASEWKAWILSESIRRLWITATLMEAAFLIWQQGSSVCPGSIGFTGRNGLWDASTPHSWKESLQGSSTTKNPVFCRRLDRLIDDAKPSDVDEFTQALLSYGRGREDVEDWVASE